MLKNLMMEKSYDLAAVKAENKALGEKLGKQQQEIKKSGIPVIVLVSGFSASGKGSLIGKTIMNIDPRGFHMRATKAATEDEQRKPFMNRFWMDIPANGEIVFFDRGWYYDYSKKNKERINIFERTLTDNGYLIIKIFLSITKKEQKERFDKLQSVKSTAWRVTKKDLLENKNFDKTVEKYDEMLDDTNNDFAKWNVISGMEKNVALNSILKIVTDSIDDRLHLGEKADGVGILPENTKYKLVDMPLLKDVELDGFTMEENAYKSQLDRLQKKLNKLSYKLYKKQIPMVICYEGWDAGGKGGNIRRVSAALDPRDYEVTPVAAPDKYEKDRHFLFRFERSMPKTGHIQIFDRTWYGRVMVERLEGFCSEKSWKRAYNEINEFENQLVDWGAVVVKFWLQIDKDEQLSRFTERQNTPEKQWKITDEDWRNREKWDQYEVAVNDMIKYTSTEKAPWTIVEANCKEYARIKALETIIEAIEERLKKNK